jgi:hypothetical protein
MATAGSKCFSGSAPGGSRLGTVDGHNVYTERVTGGTIHFGEEILNLSTRDSVMREGRGAARTSRESDGARSEQR